jgi:hypothetical protein
MGATIPESGLAEDPSDYLVRSDPGLEPEEPRRVPPADGFAIGRGQHVGAVPALRSIGSPGGVEAPGDVRQDPAAVGEQQLEPRMAIENAGEYEPRGADGRLRGASDDQREDEVL